MCCAARQSCLVRRACPAHPHTPRALALHPLQANQAVALYQLGQDNRAIKAMR